MVYVDEGSSSLVYPGMQLASRYLKIVAYNNQSASLINNQTYILLGEPYHRQILIGLDYKLLTHFFFRKLQIVL